VLKTYYSASLASLKTSLTSATSITQEDIEWVNEFTLLFSYLYEELVNWEVKRVSLQQNILTPLQIQLEKNVAALK
jgi:hypothetical protein